MKCRRILIIEPNRKIRDALGHRLEEREFSVRYARDEKTALEELMRGDLPDVILLELELQNVSGWELLAHQKSLKGISKIPTLVFSSHSPDLDIELFESLERLCAGEKIQRPRADSHRSPLLHLPTQLKFSEIG